MISLSTDSLDDLKRRELTFYQVAKRLPKETKDQQFSTLKQDYQQLINGTQEKMTVVSQLYDMIDRHGRRLDVEIKKFAEELETDYPGITAELEKKSLLLDTSSTIYPSTPGTSTPLPQSQHSNTGYFSNAASRSSSPAIPSTPLQPSSPYVLANNEIPKQSLGRKKTIGSTAFHALFDKKFSHQETLSQPEVANETVMNESIVPSLQQSTTQMVVDPNEPRYCYCQQVSHGEMIGCDDPECALEWFHYGCVGLTEAPKGKWFCRDCLEKRKKKYKKHSSVLAQ